MKYDFDYLKNLYIEDPEQFKKITDNIIADAINGARTKDKDVLRAKQWRLEHELNKIENPIERMNRFVTIFWKGVNEFVSVTKNQGITEAPTIQTKECNVVDFKKKSTD